MAIIQCEQCKAIFDPENGQLRRHESNVTCPKCGEWTTINENTLKPTLFGFRGKRNYNDPNPEPTNDY